MKVGNSLAIYASNDNFLEALRDLKSNYQNLLDDSDKKMLDDFDKVMEAKKELLQVGINKLHDYPIMRGNFYRTHVGTQKARLERFHNAESTKTPGLFTLFGSLQNLNEANVFITQDAVTLNKNTKYSRFSALLTKLGSTVTDRTFIVTTPEGCETFKEYFEPVHVYQLDEMTDADRARIKEERRLAKASGTSVEVSKELCFSYRGNKLCYEQVKSIMQEKNLKCILGVRARLNERGIAYTQFKVPKTDAEGRGLKSDDLTAIWRSSFSPRSVLDITNNQAGYMCVTVSLASYKKMKLWNDPELIPEYEGMRTVLKEFASVPKYSFVEYNDNLLNYTYIDEVEAGLKEVMPENGEETRFWKLFSLARKRLDAQAETRRDCPAYDVLKYQAEVFEHFRVENPVTTTRMERPLFEDYPMLKNYGGSYACRLTLNSNTDDYKDIWDYVTLVESKRA